MIYCFGKSFVSWNALIEYAQATFDRFAIVFHDDDVVTIHLDGLEVTDYEVTYEPSSDSNSND